MMKSNQIGNIIIYEFFLKKITCLNLFISDAPLCGSKVATFDPLHFI